MPAEQRYFYTSVLGEIQLVFDREILTWLGFQQTVCNSRASGIQPIQQGGRGNVAGVRRWLDEYFSGKIPGFTPEIKLNGTPFQKKVWDILADIPYGCAVTYGDIARIIARERGLEAMSAQAVGQAVGRNPVSIIIPCHRVLGAGGRLTGYEWGLDKKRGLLDIEGISYRSLS